MFYEIAVRKQFQVFKQLSRRRFWQVVLLKLQAEDLEYYKQEDSLKSVYWEFFWFFFETAILYNNQLWRRKTAVDVYRQTEVTALLLSVKNKLDDCHQKPRK